jgi:hypothetical protein
MLQKNFRILEILVCFFIPVNIYVIGNWVGAGIQWILFKYQQSFFGNSFTTIFDDWYYIESGTITGKSVFSILTWLFAVILILISLISITLKRDKSNRKFKIAGIFLILAGCMFTLSLFIQYGLFLSSPAGLSIPIGIPLIFFIGLFNIYHITTDSSVMEEAELT